MIIIDHEVISEIMDLRIHRGIEKTIDSAFRIIDKRYNSEHGRNIQKELSILTFIKTIFELTIGKMELAVALPSLILDSKLSMILTTDEMNVINIFLCNNEFCSECLLQSASMNQELTTNACFKNTCYNASRFDHIIHKVLKILDKHIDVLRTSSHYKHISVASALFLCNIYYFLEYILCRIYFIPEQARNKELHYRKLWRYQKRSIEDITKFTTDLERQRINHKKMLEDIIKRYRKNMVAIDEIDKKCNENVTNTNNKYKKKQLVLYKTWELERNEIKLALENVIDDFKSLKDINAKLKQTIRKQRSITESKLLVIITKYDKEIGSRYQTLKELSEAYNYDKLEKHVLEKEMKRLQREEYFVSIRQKQKSRITHFRKRLATFKQEYSARIIQHWWRKIFWNREAKKEVEKKGK